MHEGIFSISLDFELHWGGFEKWPLEKYRQYFLNTRKVIPEMLDLFAKYDVHVTWATVGLLFHKTKHELLDDVPDLKPAYHQQELSAYHYINTYGIGENETTDPFHFAADLLEQIRNTPHQEIGTHTFAHYYCNESGQTVEQFKADLMAAKHAAERVGVALRSLVFPRNQFNEQYLRVCKECGIMSVRSNPNDWFWQIKSTQNESSWTRLNRGLDAYLPVGRRTDYPTGSLSAAKDLPLCIPASRLLRPYNPKELFLNSMKIGRIKHEMKRAAKDGNAYHLWWHPHNFGSYPAQSLAALEEILISYRKLHNQYAMQSMTMHELATAIEKRDAKETAA